MTTPAPYDAAAARTTALNALSAWARTHDQSAAHRAQLLALAWHTGNRNIQELARLADVTRDTVYSDFKTVGIDWTDRKAAVTPPRYEPLRADTVAQIAALAGARFIAPMLASEPDPLAEAAWHIKIALERISTLLEDDASPGDRLGLLDDLAARGGYLTTFAHRLMAAENPPAQLVAHTDNDAVTSLDLSEPVICGATLTLQLPDGQTAVLQISQFPDQPMSLHSKDLRLGAQLDGAAHLAVTTAFAALAAAIGPSLPDDVMAYDDPA